VQRTVSLPQAARQDPVSRHRDRLQEAMPGPFRFACAGHGQPGSTHPGRGGWLPRAV